MASAGPRLGDAFGAALEDYHHNGADMAGQAYFERSDGLIVPESIGIYFAEHSTWNPVLAALVETADEPVLDVGCGAGKHSLHLQGSGMDVTGLDISPGAITVSRARGLRQAVLGDLWVDLSRNHATVLMLGGGLSLLGDIENRASMLERLAELTPQDGRIIAQAVDLDLMPAHDPLLLRIAEANLAAGRPRGLTVHRIRYLDQATAWFQWWLPTEHDLSAALRHSAWRLATYDTTGPGMAVISLEKG